MRRDGLAAVAEWERDNGALTDAEMAEARRQVVKELIAGAGRLTRSDERRERRHGR